MNSDVTVTGVGLACSIGNTLDDVVQCLRENRTGLAPVEFLQNPDLPVRLAGTVKGFEVDSPHWQNWKAHTGNLPPRRLLMSLPPHGVYAYHALLQALEDAGLTPEDLANPETGLFCASAGSAMLTWYHLQNMHQSSGKRGSPLGVVSSTAGTLNFNFGAHFGIKGCNLGFASACASSSHAIGYAWEEIVSGRQKRMVVIGAEDLNAESVLPFVAMRAVSPSGDVARACCPFDRDRTGFLPGGGAAVLILERADIARERGRGNHPHLVGWAQSADGYSPAIPDPEGNGIELAMRRALDRAHLSPGDIEYLNAHATGTGPGDLAEGRAILRLFQDKLPLVSSTKGLTGHTLSMAGALEAALCILSLRHGLIPANTGFENADDELAELPIVKQCQFCTPRFILSSNSGFGGSNTALIFRAAT